jgi:hypothetical protein
VKAKRVRPSRYFLIALGACPPCGFVAAVVSTFLAEEAGRVGFFMWALAILVAVPAGLAFLIGRRARMTRPQVDAGAVGAASLALGEGFVILLVALWNAHFE